MYIIAWVSKKSQKNCTLDHTCLAIVVVLDHYVLCSHVYHGNLSWVEAKVALLVITSKAKGRLLRIHFGKWWFQSFRTYPQSSSSSRLASCSWNIKSFNFYSNLSPFALYLKSQICKAINSLVYNLLNVPCFVAIKKI